MSIVLWPTASRDMNNTAEESESLRDLKSSPQTGTDKIATSNVIESLDLSFDPGNPYSQWLRLLIQYLEGPQKDI